jgi:hypothetical protein
MADVMARLRSLYALATHETTPVDEARTAALALLREAKKHGVTVSFRKEGATSAADGREAPPPSTYSNVRPQYLTWPCAGFCGQRVEYLGNLCAACQLERSAEYAGRRRARPEPPPPPQCKRCRAPLPSDRVEYCTTCLEHRWQETRAKEPPKTGPGPRPNWTANTASSDDMLQEILRNWNSMPFDFSPPPRRRK